MWYLIVYISWENNGVDTYVQRSHVSKDRPGYTKMVYSFINENDAYSAQSAVMDSTPKPKDLPKGD